MLEQNDTFSVAAVISDHCVFQRNTNITLFGKSQKGDFIEAEMFNQNGDSICKNNTVASSEDWILQLPSLNAQNNCTLKIKCTKKDFINKATSETAKIIEKTFTDIAIGEVWLAGGQSNMEFELHNCTEGPDELKNEKNPNVRFYYTNKIAWMDENFYKAEKQTCWQTWDSEYKTAWSAVGYFFAKQLAQDLGVTVGVIGCNWGGTSASAWMNKESLEKDFELKTYLDEQEEATKGKSIEQQCEEYDKYVLENDKWQEKCNKLYAENPDIEWDEVQKILGPSLWPGPKSCKNPYRPAGLYECMLKRIIPYSIKGVLWYQGESDDHKPAYYAKLFTTMIDVWRTEWNNPSLPFVFVQLPGNRYKQDKDFKHWCFIREAQQKVNDTVKNAYMTCALDLGQYNDIHPKAKKELANRMEKVALTKIYKQYEEEKALSPMLQDTFIQGNTIKLIFSNAQNGFEQHPDEENFNYYKQMENRQGTPVSAEFTGFEIAGDDGIYYPAEFTFGTNKNELNTITLSSPKVQNPRFARYAWYNFGPITIYGKNKLPLAPFRTSQKDSEAATEHAKIQQIMTV